LAGSPRKAGQLAVKRRFSLATRALELPLHGFLQRQGVGAIVLFIAAVAALIWANSRWAGLYQDISHAYFDITIGPLKARQSILHWINDGLMTIFFFLVGMEIKYEVLRGHLSSWKKAALPAIAALGGSIVPVGIYILFNHGTAGAHGWGIPMATDIAFAVGVLALLPSISDELRVFLLALAIVDDIAAIVVIAIFYSQGIYLTSLLIAAGLLLLIIIGQRVLPRFGILQIILAFLFWMAVLSSGVHATLAGVILAFTVSAESRFDLNQFETEAGTILHEFKQAVRNGETGKADHLLGALETLTIHTDPPIDRLTRAILPLVTLVILPLFALANAGVTLTVASIVSSFRSPVFWGIAAGLLIGKPVGIAALSWLAVRVRLAEFPEAATMREIIGVGILGGIGFTVALFVASIAFQDPDQLEAAKFAILSASCVAGLIGYLTLRLGENSVAGHDTSPD
jgi:NhaA family Na+:H+ antiporter